MIALSVLTAACLLAWGTAGPHVGPRALGANGFVQTLSGTGGRNDASTLDKPYVILVGFDGFGHDYVDRFETPNFDRIAAAGAKADALIPPFPSLTFPSFYSIATEMYPEHHGIVGNRVYDPDLDESYSYQEPETVQDGRWYSGQPIWVTAETQGMVAAAYFLPGTEAEIQGVRPTFWTPTIARSPIKRGSIRCSPGSSSRPASGLT